MADRWVIQIPLEDGLVCLRGISPRRLRFEVEYGLERGTCHNSFLFQGVGNSALLVHPPGAAFAEPFLQALTQLVPTQTKLTVVQGDVNPNRVALLQQLVQIWPKFNLVASNAGAKLLEELWQQTPLPAIEVVKHELQLPLADGFELQLLALPTPRWPGGLAAFHSASGLLMSGRFFGAHLCTESYAETNPTSSSEDRRYYYDCLMAPMANQVELVVNRLEELAIRSIAPGHGPAIVDSWRSLLADYRRWGEAQRKASISASTFRAKRSPMCSKASTARSRATATLKPGG
ncbi:MAG: MBL fold metallo-hydrolase [Synechococcaceae bacterium WB5_2A_257]|nr:MBL fold metallo-hydrolase [Synechococcaceae bacterium WB5_2A_257]